MEHEIQADTNSRFTPQERSILVTGVYLRDWRITFCDSREGEYGYVYRGDFDAPASWIVRKSPDGLIALDQNGREVARAALASELIYGLAGSLPQVTVLDQLGIRRIAKLLVDCYGHEACDHAQRYVEQSHSTGDREGARAWHDVSQAVAEMRRDWLYDLINDEMLAFVARH